MIEIREAQSEDVSTIYKLGRDVNEFHTSDQAPNFWPKEVLQNCIGKEDVYFFVATTGNEVVGFIIANRNKSLRKVEIENIFVSPDSRRRGIGSDLAGKVVAAAKTDQIQFISALTPPSDLAAIKTYEEVGFIKGETFLWLDIA
jgi:ribosomal protein S18 acetylase RimI-like enzyme